MSDEYKKGYKHGYADAMNWKVQNHLEHLPVAQPELTLDGLTPTEFALRELYEFQEATGCDTAAEFKAQPAVAEQHKQEPVAWESILGAVARGWCYEENANKTMDSELAVAITKEVQALYTTPYVATPRPQRTAAEGEDTRRAWVNATTWRGLTDDEMFKTWLTVPAETEDRLAFGRAVEAKLKAKNERKEKNT